jgi:hypothetical protein
MQLLHVSCQSKDYCQCRLYLSCTRAFLMPVLFLWFLELSYPSIRNGDGLLELL